VASETPHTIKDNDLARFTSFYTIHEISQHKIRSNKAPIEVQQRFAVGSQKTPISSGASISIHLMIMMGKAVILLLSFHLQSHWKANNISIIQYEQRPPLQLPFTHSDNSQYFEAFYNGAQNEQCPEY
jgi:hypothetical protein